MCEPIDALCNRHASQAILWPSGSQNASDTEAWLASDHRTFFQNEPANRELILEPLTFPWTFIGQIGRS
jgi:hypothetical protein